MSNAEQLTIAGDIVYDYAELTNLDGFGIDVIPQILEIQLNEDIFGVFLNGTVTLLDSQNIRGLFPLTGKEIFRFKIHTPTLKDAIEGEFFIYSLSPSYDSTKRSSVYTLSFVSKESIYDENLKVSKSFKGSPSEMMSELLGVSWLKSEKPFEADSTENTFGFVANFWKPSQCIQYILGHSKNHKGAPDFLFYETKNGFKFKSIETLITEGDGVLQSFEKSDYENTMNGKNSLYRDIERDYRTILSINDLSGFNYYDRIREGYFGGQVMTYDGTIQRYTAKSLSRSFDMDSHLNPYPPITKNVPVSTQANISTLSKAYNNIDGFGNVSNYDLVAPRKEIISRLKTTKLIIQVYGRSDYIAGKRAVVKINKNAQIENGEDPYDPLTSGVYLISAIKHILTPNSHKCNIELIKDSFIESIEKIRK